MRNITCTVAGCDARKTRNAQTCAYHGKMQASDVPIDPAKACFVEGCGRPRRTKHLCEMHRRRIAKHGSLDRGWQPAERCSAPGCPEMHHAQGMCHRHYCANYNKTRDRIKDYPCSVDGCGSPALSKSWCSVHYNRWKDHGDPLAEVRPRAACPPPTCTVGSCAAPHFGKGMCERHYGEQYFLRTRPRRAVLNRRNYLANPERASARRARRRVRLIHGMSSADIDLSTSYRQAIGSDRCHYCHGDSAHVDHFFPIAKGGTDHWWNLVRACASCNLKKSSRCGTWFKLWTGWVNNDTLSALSNAGIPRRPADVRLQHVVRVDRRRPV